MIYEFISPIVTDLDISILNKHLYNYMCSLGDKGLAIYIKDNLLKPNIKDICLTINNNQLLTIVKSNYILNDITIGILEDYLINEFIYVNKYFQDNNIDLQIIDMIYKV